MPEQPFDDFDLGGVEEDFNEDEELNIRDLEASPVDVKKILETYGKSNNPDPHTGVIVFNPDEIPF